MHTERYTVPQRTVDAIHETHAAGGRVIAVGTTSVRSLEMRMGCRGGRHHGARRREHVAFPAAGQHVPCGGLPYHELPRAALHAHDARIGVFEPRSHHGGLSSCHRQRIPHAELRRRNVHRAKVAASIPSARPVSVRRAISPSARKRHRLRCAGPRLCLRGTPGADGEGGQPIGRASESSHLFLRQRANLTAMPLWKSAARLPGRVR